MTLIEFIFPALKKSSYKDKVLGILFYEKKFNGKKSLTVNEIRKLLQRLRIPYWAKINITDVLTKGGQDFEYEKNPDGEKLWFITDSGEKSLAKYFVGAQKNIKTKKYSGETSDFSNPIDGEAEIFISHSSKDKELVDSFVSNILRLGLEVAPNKIFCTSLDGMGIRSGEDFRSRIGKAIKSSKIIFLFITPNYKKSEICLNEMGAAWLQETRIIPLIDKRMAGTKVGVVLEPKQYLALNDSDKLDDLHDIIPKDLDIPKTAATFWNSGKKKFMKVLEIYFDP